MVTLNTSEYIAVQIKKVYSSYVNFTVTLIYLHRFSKSQKSQTILDKRYVDFSFPPPYPNFNVVITKILRHELVSKRSDRS